MIELKKSQDLLIWNSKKMYYHSKKSHQRTWKLKRGEVYFVDLGENIGSEENKIRPCVVLGVPSGKRGITTLRTFKTPCKPLILLRL